jgi:hypothetical protein
MSAWAGLRACEIANLDWSMTLELIREVETEREQAIERQEDAGGKLAKALSNCAGSATTSRRCWRGRCFTDRSKTGARSPVTSASRRLLFKVAALIATDTSTARITAERAKR